MSYLEVEWVGVSITRKSTANKSGGLCGEQNSATAGKCGEVQLFWKEVGSMFLKCIYTVTTNYTSRNLSQRNNWTSVQNVHVTTCSSDFIVIVEMKRSQMSNFRRLVKYTMMDQCNKILYTVTNVKYFAVERCS